MTAPRVSPLLALALAACRPAPRAPRPTTTPGATAVAAPDATAVAAPDATAVAAPDVPAAPADASRAALADARVTPPARTAQVPRGGTISPMYDAAATASGAVVVWAVHDERSGRSDLLALALDPDGRAAGAPRRLRRTTGAVQSLSIASAGDALWVAWIAAPGSAPPAGEDEGVAPGEYIVAALRASADLATVARPATLSHHRVAAASRPWPSHAIEVSAASDGGAAVIATGTNGRCVHSHDESGEHAERMACAGWNEYRLDPVGRVSSSNREDALTPAEVPHSLVRVPGGWVYVRGDDHVGYKTFFHTIAEAPGAPGIPGAFTEYMPHHLGVRLAWSGEALVALGDYTESQDQHPASRARVRVHRADGTPVTRARVVDGMEEGWPTLTSAAVRCAGGHAVVRLRWRGGALDLDPTLPEASFRLGDVVPDSALGPAGDRVGALAWAGRALVGVDTETGRVVRWVCRPSGALAAAR